MADKFQDKYRIPSARLQTWDYGSNAAYFITICTKNREHFFGEIIGSEPAMQLNKLGKLANRFWLDIPHYFPFIQLKAFIVMPNHVHGILIIDNVETRLIAAPPLIVPPPLITPPTTPSANKTGGITGDKNPMLHENISRVIRWYKGRCTFEIRKIHADFNWQSRFHDHIIRNAESFEKIQDYIQNNPLNWKQDKFYS